MGKKKQPFYRIVAIDSRESRDGKYLENLGYYNPVTKEIDLKVKADRALYWLGQGAQPSDTVRSLLRREGVMLRFDLLKRGKEEEEIAREIKKWKDLQEEKVKRREAALIQAKRTKTVQKAEDKPKKEAAPAAAKAEEATPVVDAPEAAPAVEEAEKAAPSEEPEAPAPAKKTKAAPAAKKAKKAVPADEPAAAAAKSQKTSAAEQEKTPLASDEKPAEPQEKETEPDS